MNKLFCYRILLVLILTNGMFLTANLKNVRGSWVGTVYIRADGHVDPPWAPITTYDNVTYILTGNITSSGHGIIVERMNIIIDGQRFTVKGEEVNYRQRDVGILIYEGYNITVKNLCVENFEFGLWLARSSLCTIHGNIIVNNLYCGVGIYSSLGITISNNTITENPNGGISVYGASPYSRDIKIVGNKVISNELKGISVQNCSRVVIIENKISGNARGICVQNSTDLQIAKNNITQNIWGIECFSRPSEKIVFQAFHNNFINNTFHVMIYPPSSITGCHWDAGYPYGGNYWSGYTGKDLYSGPFQNETGSDGIGDAPYIIDEENVDRYPLMKPWIPQAVLATIDINPQTLNPLSKGRWIGVYIKLQQGYDVTEIIDFTITLNGTIPAIYNSKTIRDYDNDGILEFFIKFDRQTAIDLTLTNVNLHHCRKKCTIVTLTVAGKLKNGVLFQGSDIVVIVRPLSAYKCFTLET